MPSITAHVVAFASPSAASDSEFADLRSRRGGLAPHAGLVREHRDRVRTVRHVGEAAVRVGKLPRQGRVDRRRLRGDERCPSAIFTQGRGKTIIERNPRAFARAFELESRAIAVVRDVVLGVRVRTHLAHLRVRIAERAEMPAACDRFEFGERCFAQIARSAEAREVG
jgi:hypothetical protein